MIAARVARFHAAADRSWFLPTFVLLLVPNSRMAATHRRANGVSCLRGGLRGCRLSSEGPPRRDALAARAIGGAIDEHFSGERKDLRVEPTDRTYDIA